MPNEMIEKMDYVEFANEHGASWVFSLAPEKSGQTRFQMWEDIALAVVQFRDRMGMYISGPEELPPRPPPVNPDASFKDQRSQIEALSQWEASCRSAAAANAAWELVQKIRTGDKSARAARSCP